jgi:hypothetical protein
VIQFLIKLLIEGGMMKSTDHNLSKSVLPILDRIQVLSCDSYLKLDFAPIMASFRTSYKIYLFCQNATKTTIFNVCFAGWKWSFPTPGWEKQLFLKTMSDRQSELIVCNCRNKMGATHSSVKSLVFTVVSSILYAVWWNI